MDRDTVIPKVGKIPGRNASVWLKKHNSVAALTTLDQPVVWDRSRPATGPFFTDVDGNVILDFTSHVCASPLGYNHPDIMSFLRKFCVQDPDRYAGSDLVGGFGAFQDNPEMPTVTHLHYKIREITRQFGFSRSFLVNSGSEAVENCIKLAYAKRRNYGYGICFDSAFHGRTLGVLSLNRSKSAHRAWYPKIPNIKEFSYCDCKDGCTCGWIVRTKNGKTLSALRAFVEPKIGITRPEEIAYIIFEPVQGEGGYRIPNKEFVSEIFDIAYTYDIPVICDEVQSGMGRTGKWWAIEHYRQKPDLVSAGKALRIGAAIGKESMFPKEMSRISSTWGEGNALSSAVGYKTIDIIQKNDLLHNADVKGRYLIGRLREFQEKHHSIVDVRGIGLMTAFELDTQKRRDEVQKNCLKQGLFLFYCGYKSIRVLPPLDVTKREIDLAIDILERAMQ